LRKLEDKSASDNAATASDYPSRTRFIQFYTVCYKRRAIGGKHDSKTSCSHIPPMQPGIEITHQNTDENTELPTTNRYDVPSYIKEKERLFCKLARQDDGQVDPLWKKVTKETSDEITAHMSLFQPGSNYNESVEQVSETMAIWVSDASKV
jgi:hypothetical protein